MAEMARALRAQDLGADHAVAMVPLFVDMAFRSRLGEARPAAAGVELGIGLEQGLPATGTDIGAGFGLILVLARERPLGRLLAQDRVLHRRQFLAPLGFALDDFVGCFGVGHKLSLSGEALNWTRSRLPPASASRCSFPQTASSGSRPSAGRCRQYKAGWGAA